MNGTKKDAAIEGKGEQTRFDDPRLATLERAGDPGHGRIKRFKFVDV